MGYIDDLKNKSLEELAESIGKLSAEEADNKMLVDGLAVASFSMKKKDVREVLTEVDSLIKTLNKTYKKTVNLRKGIKRLILKVKKDKSFNEEQKEELLTTLNKYDEEFINVIGSQSKQIKKVEKTRKRLVLRLYNRFVHIFVLVASILVAVALNCSVHAIGVIAYISTGVLVFGFVIWQIEYAIEFLASIKANRQGVILYCIKKIVSTTLIVWWYLLIISASNSWNLNICGYSFAVIIGSQIIATTYELFLISNFFDEVESNLSLAAATIMGLSLSSNIINNEIIARISGWATLIACLLLSIIIIKKFLLDKPNIDSMGKVVSLIGILLFTIVETLTALYLVFWVKSTDGQVVDNTLFSAIVGVYAALLGGGLTLAGVAWTIKNTAREKADEEKKKAKPVFVSNRVFEDIDATKEKVCFDELDVTTSFDCHVIAEIENSNNSSFTMLQVYHDGQWRKIEGDSIILPNKKVYFDFLFTNDVNNLFLEVKDCLANSYFFEIKVLQRALINGATATSSHVEHTIRTLKEITIEEINERIKSEAK